MTDALDLSEPIRLRRCATCGSALLPDRKWVCLADQFAAERAVEQAGPGQVVRPSMVDAEREK